MVEHGPTEFEDMCICGCASWAFCGLPECPHEGRIRGPWDDDEA